MTVILRMLFIKNDSIYVSFFRSDRYLFTGNTNGFISAWDVSNDSVLKSNDFKAHYDAVNGLR